MKITYRDRDDPYAGYAEAFNSSHDGGVQVEPSMKPVQSKYRSLISQINAGNAPEVVGLDVVYLPRFVQLGALMELDGFYEELGYTDEFFAPLQEDFIQWKGSTYGLPFWIDCSLYAYNKNHYREAGLDPESPPETFSEFLDACDALDQAGYTPLSNTLGFVGLELFFFMPHVWAGGGKMFNDDLTECLIDEKAGAEALEFFLKLQENNYSTDQTSTEEFTYPAYYSENASMVYGGGEIVGATRRNNEALLKETGFAMFPGPQGGGRSSFIGGNSISITAQTEGDRVDAAKEFVKWVNSEEGMRTTVEEMGYLPARKSGFELEYVKDRMNIYGAFQNALKQGHAPPMHPKLLEMQEPLNNAITRALLGEQDPRAALSEAAKTITNRL